ncbi:MAG: DUF1801 domain-containing protein [Methylococcaceae bacterium]|nr:DUF1801 domain-containing protein [Methylococcaceae bacterium]
MKIQPSPSKDIDAYIAEFPNEIADLLREIRITIAKTAPAAEEKISYRIPTFTLKGNLVHFAAFKNHIGFYPGSSGIAKFKEALSSYETAKGTVRFPFDRPIPFDLIAAIVNFRVKENLDMFDAKRKK